KPEPKPEPKPKPAPRPAPEPLVPMLPADTPPPAAPSPVPSQAPVPATAAAPSTVGAASAPAAPDPKAAAASAPAAPASTGPTTSADWSGNEPPRYPAAARRMGDEGEVRLDVLIGADGSVKEVRLSASSGSPLLDEAAMRTVRTWRFKPATANGVPVEAWYRGWRWIFRLR
ncbi:MAG: TonB family protein, partial [Burkholderiales bacterium]